MHYNISLIRVLFRSINNEKISKYGHWSVKNPLLLIKTARPHKELFTGFMGGSPTFFDRMQEDTAVAFVNESEYLMGYFTLLNICLFYTVILGR